MQRLQESPVIMKRGSLKKIDKICEGTFEMGESD